MLFSVEAFGVSYKSRAGSQEALHDITLSLAAGRHLAILGESGSGKSTLALALAGLLPANAVIRGAVKAPGFTSVPKLGPDIGMVFQDPGGSLDPLMRVGDQIAESYRVNRGGGSAEAKQLAVEWLQRVAIPQPIMSARKYPHQFSGGQKQRIALAAALVSRPSVLIADEPASALDPISQAGVVRLLKGLAQRDGLTLIFVTHDIALAAEIADDVAILFHGRLVEAGSATRVFSAPAHPYAASLLAMLPKLGMARPKRFAEMNTADFSVRLPGDDRG